MARGGSPSTPPRPGVCAIAILVLTMSATARAQPLPNLPPPPPPPSSTSLLVSQLVRPLFARAPEPATRIEIQVSGAAVGREEATRFLADALEAELRRISADFVRVGGVRAGDEARERVEVVLALKDGHVVATARRRVLPATIWDAMAEPDGRVTATSFGSAPLDVELRGVFGLGRREVQIERSRIINVSKKTVPSVFSARILDCAVVDLDGDREPELVVVSPGRVRALRWEDGGFSQELGVFDLTGLPANEARLRDPLGRVVPVTRADGSTLLVAASSERHEAVVLQLTREGLGRSAVTFQRGWPLYATGVDALLIGPWPLGIDSLEGGLTEARFGTAAASWIGGATKLHDVRASYVAGRPMVWAARVGGSVSLGAPAPHSTLSGLGVTALVTDLDADARPEWITTSLALSGPDRISMQVLTPRPPGLPPLPERAGRPVWTGAVDAPVTAMCSGDVDRDGFEEVVVATHDGRAAAVHLLVPR